MHTRWPRRRRAVDGVAPTQTIVVNDRGVCQSVCQSVCSAERRVQCVQCQSVQSLPNCFYLLLSLFCKMLVFSVVFNGLKILYSEYHLLLGCIECMRCRRLLLMFAVSVRLSVTRLISASLCKNGWTEPDAVLGEHSWGPWNIVLDVGSDLPTDRGRESTFKFWDPFISPERLKLQNWNLVCL